MVRPLSCVFRSRFSFNICSSFDGLVEVDHLVFHQVAFYDDDGQELLFIDF